ncbi:phage tail tape measure protein [Rhodococcoides fascians]|uniref:phage tail tape measure protein n=1 Tax=Rhodococcoides fascians TaxID=1828 RepID=UPI00050CA0CC|nr:phage tail tape measure protein [Rhodococcus fascians]
MSLNVGELVATLTIDDDRYTRGMAAAQATSVRMGQTATETSRTVQRSNEQAATSYQQLAQQAQRSQSQAETAQTRARNAVENRTAAERNMRDVLERVGTTEADRAQAARRLESAIDQATSAQERARDATRRYQQAQGQAERSTDQFRDAARRAETEVRSLGEAGERTARQMSQIGDGVQDSLEGAFEGAEDVAGRSGGAGGGNFLAGFTSKLGDLGGKGGPIAGALLGVAAVGLVAGKALADAIAQGMEFDAMSDQLQAKLGVDEETMRTIAKASGAAYGNVFGESVAANMDTARRAIQNGLLDPSDSANDMQPVIEQLDTVASLLESDIPEVAEAAGKMVRSGFVDNAVAALDLLAAAEQNNLAITGDLLDTMGEYSIQFAKVGLDGPTALGLVSQAMQGGARDTDVAADAVKEFAIRAVDGSESTSEAYGKLGLNVDDTITKLMEGGEAGTAALDSILDSLREMEPGVERNQVAAALFGTQWEDLAGAFDKFDVSNAAGQLGEVAGAAERAADTMAGNTKAKFEQAQRAVELSMSGVKMAIADGFMPSLDKAVDWVNTHQPEIIGFFTRLADAGFVTLDAILAFTSGSLRGLADWGEVVGATMGTALQAIGGFAEFAGGIVKHLPGMQDVGEAIEGAGEKTQWYADQVQSSSEKLNGLADMIDGVRPGIQGMREDFANAGEAAQLNAEMARALTDELTAVPDGKDIVIESNTPEQTEALEKLGLKVTEMPDGKFRVTSNTDEGQKAIDAFVRANNDKNIQMFVDLRQRQIGYWQSRGVSEADAPLMQGPVPVVPNADGNVYESHDPQIGDGRTARVWNEPETQGESYIPHAPSKRSRAEKILAVTAEKFGLGLVRSFADGGIIDREGLDASMAWAKSVDPARYGMGGFSSDVLDCSGAVSGAINKALGLDAFDSRMSTVNEGEWLQAKGAILGRGPAGTLRVGWWDEGGGANGHTALTYPDDTNFESNGSEGVVVGGPTGADDPSFTNQAWFPLSGDLGRESGSGTAGSDSAGGKTGTVGVTDSGAVLSTDGTKVFVTNWPASMGGSDEKKPILSAGLKVFANGGFEDHSPMMVRGGDVRMFGEPETEGESYIPHAASKRPRALSITRQTANKFGYRLVPMADGGLTGFGGWQNDDRPTLDIPLDGRGMSANKQRASFNNLLALAVGGANTLASGFDGDGKFTGQFDTGSNSPAVLEKALKSLTDIASAQLEEQKRTTEAAATTHVEVTVDTGYREAEARLQARLTGM